MRPPSLRREDEPRLSSSASPLCSVFSTAPLAGVQLYRPGSGAVSSAATCRVAAGLEWRFINLLKIDEMTVNAGYVLFNN
jgi:hypothetical protein